MATAGGQKLGFRLTLVLGGSRSGKSRYAQGRVMSHASVAYWATGLATDTDMQQRIQAHRDTRPPNWHTLEEPNDLAKGLQGLNGHAATLLDSLTTWIGNQVHAGHGSESILARLASFLDSLSTRPGQWMIVSDEVGSGVVPGSEAGRRFRDILGDANQMVAQKADEVVVVTAGIPTRIK